MMENKRLVEDVDACKSLLAHGCEIMRSWLEHAEAALASDDVEEMRLAAENLDAIGHGYIEQSLTRKRWAARYYQLLTTLPVEERARWDCAEVVEEQVNALSRYVDKRTYQTLCDDKKTTIKPGDNLWHERAAEMMSEFQQQQRRLLTAWFSELGEEERYYFYGQFSDEDQRILSECGLAK